MSKYICLMAKYKCSCSDDVIDASNVSIKFIDDRVRHDIKCEKCGEYMNLHNPKSGAPSFRSNRYGQVY